MPSPSEKMELRGPKGTSEGRQRPLQHLHQTQRRLLKQGQEATQQNSENKEEVLEAKDKMFMLEREDVNPLRSR